MSVIALALIYSNVHRRGSASETQNHGVGRA